MDEVENTGSQDQEIATPETSQEAASSREDRQDHNWKMMRRQHEELQRKAKMQEELLQKLLTQPQQQQTPVVPEPSIADDDYVQGSHVKALMARTAQEARQAAREEAEKLLQQRDRDGFMDRLKKQFSDFDDVVNSETLSLLEETDPELAATIGDLKDPYKIGLQSYKYLKASGMDKKVPTSRRIKEVDKKIADNEKTLQSPAAFEKRPMAQAFKMTEAQKKDLYKEMTHYASQGGGY